MISKQTVLDTITSIIKYILSNKHNYNFVKEMKTYRSARIEVEIGTYKHAVFPSQKQKMCHITHGW